jgi:hypothetical protein
VQFDEQAVPRPQGQGIVVGGRDRSLEGIEDRGGRAKEDPGRKVLGLVVEQRGHGLTGLGTNNRGCEIERLGLVPAISPIQYAIRLLIPQGSVAVDGVSLTVAALGDLSFEVMLIPHTLAVTTLGRLEPGQATNIEVDVIGKYLVRSLALRGTT